MDFSNIAAAASLSSIATMSISWIVRRDGILRRNAAEVARVALESARVTEQDRRLRIVEDNYVAQRDLDATMASRLELERRVHLLETEGVRRRDLDQLTKRLEDIHQDLREIRTWMTAQTERERAAA
jgi:hypothetical protein